MKISAMVMAAAGVAAVSGAAHGQLFWNLGAGASPTGISADGSAVAGTTATQYFRWTAEGGLTLIGGVAPGVSGAGGQARISDDGQFIGGTVANTSTGFFEMGRYSVASGQWTALGGLGGVSGSSVSSGWGMSGDGQSVVGLGWVTAGRAEATQWRASTGNTVSLGSTVATRSSRANSTDQDGSVVVGWQDSATGFRQAAVWTDGVQQVLTTPAGDPVSEASDVSGDGRWVVGAGASTTGNQAWRWSAEGGLEGLGTIFNPTWRGSATGIADTGKVIGFYRPLGPALFGEGFVWTPTGGMVNLTAYAISLGVPVPEGVVLSLPLSISADGLTIAGQGRSPSGGIGWVIRIPSPGVLAVLAVGGAWGLRRRRE